MTDAVVVGSGPNGLAAAVMLARQRIRVTVLEAADQIGGGTRTSELTVPGVLHDHCSAVHPLGVGSPFLRTLGLEHHGLTWRWPQVELAHPLDGGRAAALRRSVDETAAGLGADGRAWERLFEPMSAAFDGLAEDVLRPLARFPRHPLHLARFGARASQPATAVAHRWHTEEARALFGGASAHAMYPLGRPTSAATGLLLVASGHRYGWPVAQGGSRAVTDALARMLAGLGGTIRTGEHVRSLGDLPAADVVLLDLAPGAVVDLAGDALPAGVRRAYRRWRHGPAAFKVDLAVERGIPWANESCRLAGTVHLGGTYEEVAAAERATWRGEMPARPFVLVAQQYLADPSRSAGDVHPVWTYAHVPHGYLGDATPAILDQLERFAPGARERIVGSSVRTPSGFERYNPNFVGGDIATGANDPLQMLARPRIALDPYRTGIPGVFICSAATPPGAGVHGMCGFHAARSALRSLR